jgi:hypothetical protein
MSNEYAQIRFSGSVPVKTYHWKQHPYKSQAWYEYQKLEMNSPTRVAQELDIDYSASQPNKVYTEWSEPYHIITKSEVMRALPTFQNPKTKEWQIPLGHSAVMGQDVGQSHANVLLWFLTLKHGTKTVEGIDLSGSILVYRELLFPPESTPRYWSKQIKTAEGLYEPYLIRDRLISHEALTEKYIYEQEYNLHFRHWNTDYNEGISRVKDYLEIRYKHEIHPFREHTRQQKFPEAEPIKGRPTIYFVVDDDQGELKLHDSLNKFYVQPPTDSGGMFRVRSEFPMYHYPTTELGKEIKNMRPHKNFDDAMDVIRCTAAECFAPIQPLTKAERFESNLPESLRTDKIQELPVAERGMAFLMREQERKEFERKEREVGMSYRDALWSRLTKR